MSFLIAFKVYLGCPSQSYKKNSLQNEVFLGNIQVLWTTAATLVLTTKPCFLCKKPRDILSSAFLPTSYS